MEFNKLILEKLHPIFREYGLKIKKQLDGVLQYESEVLHISLAHNDIENSNSLWLGSKISGNFVEMNNQVMKEFFNIDLQLDNLSQEDFVNNIFLFFTNEGKVVLRGNESQLLKLEEFDQERSDLYTARLIEKQALEAANEAWKNGNYIEVIKYLEQINEANLSAPQKMKYKLAKRKLAN